MHIHTEKPENEHENHKLVYFNEYVNQEKLNKSKKDRDLAIISLNNIKEVAQIGNLINNEYIKTTEIGKENFIKIMIIYL